MKKITCLIVATLIVFGLITGCTNTGNNEETNTGNNASTSNNAKTDDKVITIAMLPKFKGENYFDACKIGAEEAIAELNANGVNIKLLYDGPPQDSATNQKQVDILEGWIAQKVDIIIVSPNDASAIAPTMLKAQKAGIHAMTFDADSQEDSRELFVNQATAELIAKGTLDAVSIKMKDKATQYTAENPANVAVVSAEKTHANLSEWLKAIQALLETEEYNWMRIKNEQTDIYYPGTDESENLKQAGTLIGRMGKGEDNIQIAIAITSQGTPALGAQYESAAIKPDINEITMTGIATPNSINSYVKDETNALETGVLWSCMDLGYLSIMSAYQLATDEITSSSASLTAGKLGEKSIVNKVILLGDALIFGPENIDDYNY